MRLDWRSGDRVQTDSGEVGVILYLAPAHFSDHASVRFPSGDRRVSLAHLRPAEPP